MLRIFIGYDPRQVISYNVLQHSIITNASVPVSITPLVFSTLGMNRVGQTPFSFTRFLVPSVCNFKGTALYLDADMLVLEDIKLLFDYADNNKALSLVKSSKDFEWTSLMLFNNAKCRKLTPEFIKNTQNVTPSSWCKANEIGAIPGEWNHLVGYDLPRRDAKIVHFTQGVPCFPETKCSEYADEWFAQHAEMNSAAPWEKIMGGSTHVAQVNGKNIPKFMVDESTRQVKREYISYIEQLLQTS